MVTPRRPAAEVITVETQDQLDAICRTCRAERAFAFDTEFVMEDRFEAELCLLQLANQSSVALVDPFLGLDLGPVWAMVSDEQVTTVVHAGQEDLAICVQQSGRIPRRVYDVQIAAGLAGLQYPLSLQKLVQTVLHVRLHKSKTLTNWRRRPLTAAQQHYAAEDVSCLLAVRTRLDQTLTRLKRQAWAREEFARFDQPESYRREEEDRLARLKGSGSLEGRQLAVLRDVLAWREQLGRQVNRPVRTVLKDHLLVEIARHGISTFKEARDLRGLNLNDRQVRAMCEVVQRTLATPPEQWPTPRRREPDRPGEEAVVALISGVIRSHCREHNLAYGLLASKRSIQQLVRYCLDGSEAVGEPVELLSGWRKQAVGSILREVLLGQRTLRVAPGEGGPTIRVVQES